VRVNSDGREIEKEVVERLERREKRDVLNTMISRIKTTKPRSPPPVPNFQASWVVVTISSAIAKETRKRLRRIDWIIVVVALCCCIVWAR
jgi:hypothetical protein